jgi:predicted nucleic acid-binding protein
MKFVLDVSVAVARAFADEEHPVAAAALVLMCNDQGCVPNLWWFEIRNVLVVNEPRGRLREADTALFLCNLARLPIVVDRAPEEAAVLTSARRHGLTAWALTTTRPSAPCAASPSAATVSLPDPRPAVGVPPRCPR